MRALMLALVLIVGTVHAAESSEGSRFELRSSRVQVGSSEVEAEGTGRFAVNARVSIVDAPRDPLARFEARATLKAASASCGPAGDVIFRDGFE